MHLAASSNESDILCIFGWSISKSIEKMRAQHVEPFPIIVATVDARFDRRWSNNTKSNEPNFNCRRLWKEINCQSRFKCTTFKSSKECFHQGSSVRRLRTGLWSTTSGTSVNLTLLDTGGFIGFQWLRSLKFPGEFSSLIFYGWIRNSIRRREIKSNTSQKHVKFPLDPSCL